MIKLAGIKQQFKIIYTRLFYWEYWNSAILYLPVIPYQLYLFIKARSFFFFNAANPGIKNGGLMMESKWDMYKDAPANFFPSTLYITGNENFQQVFIKLKNRFHFPLIAKPDIGSKGRGVTVIKCRNELLRYHQQCPVPYIIQQKIDYSLEAGIFYVRMPGESKGTITGIVEKKFIQVTGDGKSTVHQLLQQDARYLLQLRNLEKIMEPLVLALILPAGKTRVLVDIGNHARGANFINASYRINTRLEQVINDHCQRFPGFYFGRLDIRFSSWEELEQGSSFGVIEINGAGSEPTHIYDPANSLWYVWREICRHWRLMYKVAKTNHQLNNVAYQSLPEGWRMLLQNGQYTKKLQGFLFEPARPLHSKELKLAISDESLNRAEMPVTLRANNKKR